MLNNQPTETVLLAFDFGMRRIGVAVGQTVSCTATPLTMLLAKKGEPDWKKIEQLINDWEVTALVVGIPYNMDGSEQLLTVLARQFADQLKRFALPVYLIDERLTTKEAKYQLAKISSLKKTQNQIDLDSYAAKLILEVWLEQQK